MNDPIFKIYTDGACINNGYPNAKCSIGIHFPKTKAFMQISMAIKLIMERMVKNQNLRSKKPFRRHL